MLIAIIFIMIAGSVSRDKTEFLRYLDYFCCFAYYFGTIFIFSSADEIRFQSRLQSGPFPCCFRFLKKPCIFPYTTGVLL